MQNPEIAYMPSIRGNLTEKEKALLWRALDAASSPAEAAKAMEAFANSLRKRGLNGYDFVPADGPRARADQPQHEPPKSEPPPPKYEPKPPPPREETPPWWTRAKQPPPQEPPLYQSYRHSDGTYWPFPEPKKSPPQPPEQETPWTADSMGPQDFQRQPHRSELDEYMDEIKRVLGCIILIVALVLFYCWITHGYQITHGY